MSNAVTINSNTNKTNDDSGNLLDTAALGDTDQIPLLRRRYCPADAAAEINGGKRCAKRVAYSRSPVTESKGERSNEKEAEC